MKNRFSWALGLGSAFGDAVSWAAWLEKEIILEVMWQNFLVFFNCGAGSLNLVIESVSMTYRLLSIRLLKPSMTLSLALTRIVSNIPLLTLHLLILPNLENSLLLLIGRLLHEVLVPLLGLCLVAPTEVGRSELVPAVHTLLRVAVVVRDTVHQPAPFIR